jgi:ElaB/YqjD/DUF883 family membrane-anchored ribosome-binding protein
METRTETNRPNTSTHLSTPDTSKSQGNNKTQQGDGNVNNVIKQAKDTLNDGMEKVTKNTGEIYDSAIQYSKQNPGKAIGIALASGATLGFLIGRSSKSRYDDSLWGAVTTAALRAAIDRWS